MFGKYVSIVLNFFQLMKRFVTGGNEDTGVHIVSRRMGLWSEDSSFRLSISVRYGNRIRAMSSMSGLCLAFVGKCVGEEGAVMR